MSFLFLVFFTLTFAINLSQFSHNLSFPFTQSSPLNLQLSFTLSTYFSTSTCFPALSTLNLYFLYVHAHHVSLKYASQLSICRCSPSHQHGPRILHPS